MLIFFTTQYFRQGLHFCRKVDCFGFYKKKAYNKYTVLQDNKKGVVWCINSWHKIPTRPRQNPKQRNTAFIAVLHLKVMMFSRGKFTKSDIKPTTSRTIKAIGRRLSYSWLNDRHFPMKTLKPPTCMTVVYVPPYWENRGNNKLYKKWRHGLSLKLQIWSIKFERQSNDNMLNHML